MKKFYIESKRRKAHKDDFKPDREYINHAISEFLESGGKIKKILTKTKKKTSNIYGYVDEILIGCGTLL